MLKVYYLIFICLYSFFSCSQSFNSKVNINDSIIVYEKKTEQISRNKIRENLHKKIKQFVPLVIHTFVPLCDNDFQGIIKVGKLLGDGRNLKTNLYWGAGYGLKTFFTQSKNWKYLKSFYNIDSFVLERVVLYREYSNHAKVYLILDAYKGDKMENCIFDYFNSLAGNLTDTICIDSLKILACSKSDFLIFNGHNGLMDNRYEEIENTDHVEKDAAVISCNSYPYFEPFFERLNAYPLITTTSFLPPEAYIISSIIDNWASMESEEKIRIGAGEAMAKIHKIAVAPCVNTFKTGWD